MADVPFLDRLWADVGGDPLRLRQVSITGPVRRSRSFSAPHSSNGARRPGADERGWDAT